MNITIRRRSAGFDPYGDPTGTTTEIPATGCHVAPRTPTEVLERGREGAIDGLTLYGPAGLDIRTGDVVEVDGVRYEVEGNLGRWNTPAGVPVGVEVPLRRSVG